LVDKAGALSYRIAPAVATLLRGGGQRGLDFMQISQFKTGAWEGRERAEQYHRGTVGAPGIFQRMRHDVYLRYIQRHAAPGARILDLGCGTGLIAIALHDLGYKVVACDVSAGMLEKLADEKGERDIELRRGDGFAIPAADGEFDMVVSRMFIQHFPNWPQIVAEKARVTRPGGIVLFDFGNREHLMACDPNLGAADDFPYSNSEKDAGKFYAAADAQEMRARAAECGLDVVAIAPHGLLLYNGFLWKKLGADGIREFNARLDRILASDEATELLLMIEEAVLPLLPKSVCYGNITVLRKVGAAAAAKPHKGMFSWLRGSK
jgi:2-polyprenyl-3-methyl-5-hydroxy-6-metoxy-1,4-benzoquinol methylase